MNFLRRFILEGNKWRFWEFSVYFFVINRLQWNSMFFFSISREMWVDVLVPKKKKKRKTCLLFMSNVIDY